MSIEPDASTSRSSIFHLLRWRSVHQAGRRAFTFTRDEGDDEASVTYEALDRRARVLGALLQREAAAGDRVLLLYPPGLEYVSAFLGCLYAGAVAVSVYPPNPRLERTLSRLRAIVRDARPTVVLTTSSILSIAGGARCSRRCVRDCEVVGDRWSPRRGGRTMARARRRR